MAIEIVKDRKRSKAPKGRSDFKSFLLIVLFSCVPIFWAASLYLDALSNSGNEEYATAITIAFYAFFYIGWRIGDLVVIKSDKTTGKTLIILSGAVLLNCIWLFVHADFPIESLRALNLLLYWLPFLAVSFLSGLIVKVFRRNVAAKIDRANAGAAQSRSELQLLQSQLSPHFLFNTLNNLYGLSISQHEKIPHLLLKLSDLLRYSVHEAKELWVPLKSELEYITNYIDFEKIRIGAKLVLTNEIDTDIPEGIKIAPMLLIVFIENAFKHSKNTIEKEIFVDISVKVWNNLILFSVKNSYDKNFERTSTAKFGGLGLENVKKRLDLLYPNQFDLKTSYRDGTYSVILQLRVK